MDPLAELLAGNAAHAGRVADRFDELQDGQEPTAVTICCSDSRVLQDDLWDNDEPGRLFTCSTIGNRVTQRRDGESIVAGDVLYPLVETGTKLAIVVGHTGCGAVTATYEALLGGLTAAPPGIEYCLDLLEPHLAPGVEQLPDTLDAATAVDYLVEYNVDRQVEALVNSDDVPDDVTVVGVVYDFQDVYASRRGEVHVISIDGEWDSERLRADNPTIADRVARQWQY